MRQPETQMQLICKSYARGMVTADGRGLISLQLGRHLGHEKREKAVLSYFRANLLALAKSF